MKGDLVVILKSIVDPQAVLFTIHFYFGRSRVRKNIFFNGRMGTIIFEFPCSVCEFCAWREYFDNEAGGPNGLGSFSIFGIAGDNHIRMEVARFRNIDLHVRAIHSTWISTKKVPKNSLEV